MLFLYLMYFEYHSYTYQVDMLTLIGCCRGWEERCLLLLLWATVTWTSDHHPTFDHLITIWLLTFDHLITFISDSDSSWSIIIVIVNIATMIIRRSTSPRCDLSLPHSLLLPLFLLHLISIHLLTLPLISIRMMMLRRGTLPRCDLPPHTSTPSSLLRLNLNHVQSQLQSQSSWYYQDTDYENSVFNPILPSILFWKCTVKPIQPV